MKNFQQLKAKLLKNDLVKLEYDKLKPEYELLRKLIQKRLKKGMTQSDVAKKIGTKQEAVSRLESGRSSSTLNRYSQYADAVGSKIEISLK